MIGITHSREISFHTGKLALAAATGIFSLAAAFLFNHPLHNTISSGLFIGGVSVAFVTLAIGIVLFNLKRKEKYTLINQRDQNGDTPLIKALKTNNREAVLALLERWDVEVLCKNNEGKKARDFIKKEDKEVMQAYSKAALREITRKGTPSGRRFFLKKAQAMVKENGEEIGAALKRQGVKIASRISGLNQSKKRDVRLIYWLAQKSLEVGDFFVLHGQSGFHGLFADSISAFHNIGADRYKDPSISRKRLRTEKYIHWNSANEFLTGIVRPRGAGFDDHQYDEYLLSCDGRFFRQDYDESAMHFYATSRNFKNADFLFDHYEGISNQKLKLYFNEELVGAPKFSRLNLLSIPRNANYLYSAVAFGREDPESPRGAGQSDMATVLHAHNRDDYTLKPDRQVRVLAYPFDKDPEAMLFSLDSLNSSNLHSHKEIQAELFGSMRAAMRIERLTENSSLQEIESALLRIPYDNLHGKFKEGLQEVFREKWAIIKKCVPAKLQAQFKQLINNGNFRKIGELVPHLHMMRTLENLSPRATLREIESVLLRICDNLEGLQEVFQEKWAIIKKCVPIRLHSQFQQLIDEGDFSRIREIVTDLHKKKMLENPCINVIELHENSSLQEIENALLSIPNDNSEGLKKLFQEKWEIIKKCVPARLQAQFQQLINAGDFRRIGEIVPHLHMMRMLENLSRKTTTYMDLYNFTSQNKLDDLPPSVNDFVRPLLQAKRRVFSRGT